MLIFNIILLFIFTFGLLTLKSFKYSKQINILYLFSSLAFIAIISGLRAKNIGTDTPNYINIINNFINNGMKGRLFHKEILADLIFTLPLKIKESAHLSLLFVSLLTYLFYFIFIKRESNQYFLSLIFLYAVYFMPIQMNITRQILSGSLLLIAYSFFSDKKFLIFSLLSICAILIHISSAILIPCIIASYIIRIDSLKLRQFFILILASLASFSFILNLVLKIFPAYAHYKESIFALPANQINFTTISLCALIAFIFTSYINFMKSKELEHKYFLRNENINLQKLSSLTLLNIVIILIDLIALKAYMIVRFEYYFMPFVAILFSYIPLILKKKYAIISILVILILVLLIYFFLLSVNLCDILPYKTFYQK